MIEVQSRPPTAAETRRMASLVLGRPPFTGLHLAAWALIGSVLAYLLAVTTGLAAAGGGGGLLVAALAGAVVGLARGWPHWRADRGPGPPVGSGLIHEVRLTVGSAARLDSPRADERTWFWLLAVERERLLVVESGLGTWFFGAEFPYAELAWRVSGDGLCLDCRVGQPLQATGVVFAPDDGELWRRLCQDGNGLLLAGKLATACQDLTAALAPGAEPTAGRLPMPRPRPRTVDDDIGAVLRQP
jgi:hypothetical protein